MSNGGETASGRSGGGGEKSGGSGKMLRWGRGSCRRPGEGYMGLGTGCCRVAGGSAEIE